MYIPSPCLVEEIDQLILEVDCIYVPSPCLVEEIDQQILARGRLCIYLLFVW